MTNETAAQPSYVSHDALFHFVGRGCPTADERYEILSQILSTGVISHPPHTRDWGLYGYTLDDDADIIRGELVVPNMVCFCDIPFDHLQIHMAKYSPFGLSIVKERIYRYGGRPVTYYPYWRQDAGLAPFGLAALRDLQMQFVHFQSICEEVFGEEPETRLRRFGEPPANIEEACRRFEEQMTMGYLAFLKPFDVTLPPDHPDNYYMEREWRKIGNLKFDGDHIGQVIVPESHLERAMRNWPTFRSRIVCAPP